MVVKRPSKHGRRKYVAGSNRCENCGKAAKHLRLVKDRDGACMRVGSECARHFKKADALDLARTLRRGYYSKIVKLTKANKDFRHVVYTGKRSQLVLMSIPNGGDIGSETHKNIEQSFFFVSGHGRAIVGTRSVRVKAGDAVVVPPRTRHNFINTGSVPLRLYTIYAPQAHLAGRVHRTQADARADIRDEKFGSRSAKRKCVDRASSSARFQLTPRMKECIGDEMLSAMQKQGFAHRLTPSVLVVDTPSLFSKGKFSDAVLNAINTCAQEQEERSRQTRAGVLEQQKREEFQKTHESMSAKRWSTAIPEEKELWKARKELDEVMDWTVHEGNRDYQKKEIIRLRESIRALELAVIAKRGKLTIGGRSPGDASPRWQAKSAMSKRTRRCVNSLIRHKIPRGSAEAYCKQKFSRKRRAT